MIISTTSVVNTPVHLYFQATTGITDFTSMRVFVDGTLVSTPTITSVETSAAGLYSLTFTPSSTGRFVIYFQTNILAYLEVVSKSLYSYVKNIEDESLGSWVWDKQAGTLTMLRQDATSLATFTVVENLTTASRELVG